MAHAQSLSQRLNGLCAAFILASGIATNSFAQETKTVKPDSNIKQIQGQLEDVQPPAPGADAGQTEATGLDDSNLFNFAPPTTNAEVKEALSQPRGGGDTSAATESRVENATKAAGSAIVAAEATTRAATDTGDLLGKSADSGGVGVQRRSPISVDTRIRGYHVGQVNTTATGAFWAPARQDLDTMLGKIDSSTIHDVILLKGPYAAQYGPGFSFIDVATNRTPRYQNGFDYGGRTAMGYKTNGEQFYSRQSIWGGSSDWGFRMGYGRRFGNDYESGDNTGIPSSYKMADVDTAFGMDLSPDSWIEFNYLRVDQTDTEYPGQVFDIDFLVTDGFSLRYGMDNQYYYDSFTFDYWYNRTRFEGDAQRSGKRGQIPILTSPLNFIGFTDVDQYSHGYKAALSWGSAECPQLSIGTDLRYLQQELNERDAFDPTGVGLGPGAAANFPIPRSHIANPGVFVETILPMTENFTITAGARGDYGSTRSENPLVGGSSTELFTFLGLADQNDLSREYRMWSLYMTSAYEVNDHWTMTGALGRAERPPTLTELYAADPFLAVIQQGFSQVRGDPSLHTEKVIQFDLGVKAEYERFRGGVSGFYAFINDYITYDPIRVLAGTVVNDAEAGLGVRHNNTDLATLAGIEAYGEYDWNCWITAFGSVSYTEGRDRDRTEFDITLDPGTNSGTVVALGSKDHEPLAGIVPLQSRVGLRFHDPSDSPRWGVELGARIVDNQDRVAKTLLEQQTPGFTTYDLRGYWQATEGLTLLAGIENFTDKNYREHLDLRTGTGVFQPGINFYCGFELNF